MVKSETFALVRYEFELPRCVGRLPLNVYGGGRFGNGTRLGSLPTLRGLVLRVMACESVVQDYRSWSFKRASWYRSTLCSKLEERSGDLVCAIVASSFEEGIQSSQADRHSESRNVVSKCILDCTGSDNEQTSLRNFVE